MTVQASVRRPPLNEIMLRRGAEVIAVEAEALQALAQSLDGTFVDACNTILSSTGRVVVTGMGKSGHIGGKIAATLASTGTNAFFVHPAEMSHGDLGMLRPDVTVLAISNSGESDELTAILPVLKRLGISLVAMTGRADSTLGRHAEVVLDTSVEKEACPLNLSPTASTTAAGSNTTRRPFSCVRNVVYVSSASVEVSTWPPTASRFSRECSCAPPARHAIAPMMFCARRAAACAVTYS